MQVRSCVGVEMGSCVYAYERLSLVRAKPLFLPTGFLVTMGAWDDLCSDSLQSPKPLPALPCVLSSGTWLPFIHSAVPKVFIESQPGAKPHPGPWTEVMR